MRATASIVAACLLTGCSGIGLSGEYNLVGDNALWAVDAREQMSLVKKDGKGGGIDIVGPTVFAAGWNNDFIMIMQYPGNAFGAHDKSITNYFIFRMKEEKLLGPLHEDQFEEQRRTLGVPAELDFKLVLEDLK